MIAWFSLPLAGITGVTCLILSIRLAHASLQHKLKRRAETIEMEQKTIIHADIKNIKEQQISDKNVVNKVCKINTGETVKIILYYVFVNRYNLPGLFQFIVCVHLQNFIEKTHGCAC